MVDILGASKQEEFRRFISAHLNMPPAKVSSDLELARDLNLDEHDRLEFLLAIEDEMSVTLPDSANPRTIGELETLVLNA